MTIKAIQTRYAGCHFRSRLEARWAVFFDALGIEWEYEPQGYELEWRLYLRPDPPIRYLPDFYLPALGLWAEVKGDPSRPELDQLLNAAAALGAPAGGCGDRGGHDMLVLGPMKPRQQPALLHMHKGDLTASPWGHGRHCHDEFTVARDVGGDIGDETPYHEVGQTLGTIKDLLFSMGGTTIPGYARGIMAARSAQFEHGRSGAT